MLRTLNTIVATAVIVLFASGCGGGGKIANVDQTVDQTNEERLNFVSPLEMTLSDPLRVEDLPLKTADQIDGPGKDALQVLDLPKPVPVAMMHQTIQVDVANRSYDGEISYSRATGRNLSRGWPTRAEGFSNLGIEVTRADKRIVEAWQILPGSSGSGVWLEIWEPGPTVITEGPIDETGRLVAIISTKVLLADWVYDPQWLSRKMLSLLGIEPPVR